MPRNPPDDERHAYGRHRLTLAEINALYAVAIAGEIRGDGDFPRCRMSTRTTFEFAHHITVRSATVKSIAKMGLVALPMRRVWGESSDYGECPELTAEGRAALAKCWGAIVASVQALVAARDAEAGTYKALKRDDIAAVLRDAARDGRKEGT